MTDQRVRRALGRWGLEGCPFQLAAARENLVYRIEGPSGRLAMRLHRPGYRTDAELASELAWMAALAAAGTKVPRPVPTLDGKSWAKLDDTVIDVLTWLDAEPFGKDGALRAHGDHRAIAAELGRALAGIHRYSDSWAPPRDFVRPSWDEEGLLGETPLWGRFWESPVLSADERELMSRIRSVARADLAQAGPGLDYGLIHADAVPENVLVGDATVSIIDFDDGGYGYRLFDLATTMNYLEKYDGGAALSRSFLDAYVAERPMELGPLPLFRLLRSLTYVGWIIPRMNEDGAGDYYSKYVPDAVGQAARYLEGHGAPAPQGSTYIAATKTSR